jgi:hypothetical protein
VTDSELLYKFFPDNERGYYLHVTYLEDGDHEWMLPAEVQDHVKSAQKQHNKDATDSQAKETVTKSGRSSKTTTRAIERNHASGDADGTHDEGIATKTTKRKRLELKENVPPSKSNQKLASRTRTRLTKKVVTQDDDDSVEESIPIGRTRGSNTTHTNSLVGKRPSRRAAANKNHKEIEPESEGDDEYNIDPEVVAVSEVSTRAPAPKPTEAATSGYMELTDSSLSQDLNKFLHSRDCVFGASSIERVLILHKRYLQKELRQQLIDLLVFGPSGREKRTRFPDKHRTIAGANVANCLLRPSGMHDKFARDLVDFGWERCLEQVTKPLFAAKGDEQRTNHDAVLRVGDSLFVKAHCMEFFAELLEHEQERCSHSRDDVMKKTLLSVIAQSGQNGLKLAVTAYLHLLVNFGHLVIGHTKNLCSLPDGPTSICLEQAMAAAERLYKALGKVVSILAWHYCVVEYEKVENVSHLVGSWCLIALDSATLDVSAFHDEHVDIKLYWERIKMQFIVGLHRELVPQLRPNLANKLSVAAAYNSIFE